MKQKMQKEERNILFYIVLLFTKVKSTEALLCQELMCTTEQDCYSAYVQVGQTKVLYFITFYHFCTLVYF